MAAQPALTPPPAIFAISGSAALVTANTLLYPIEVITTKLQAQSKPTPGTPQDQTYYTSFPDAVLKILRSEGIPGLYAGLSGSILSNIVQGYCYNYWHSLLRQIYLSSAYATKPPGTAAELGLAYGAGVLSVFVTNPLANVNTRMKTLPPEERKGMVRTGRELVRSDGVTRLWRGLSASFVMCINPAITYGTIERLRILFFGERLLLRPWESFFLGMVSKAIAVVALHPVSVALVMLRSKLPAARKGKPFKSFVDVIRYIVETEGVLRLFKGLGPTLFKSMILQGILNILKERYRAVLTVLYFHYTRRYSGFGRGSAAVKPIV